MDISKMIRRLIGTKKYYYFDLAFMPDEDICILYRIAELKGEELYEQLSDHRNR